MNYEDPQFVTTADYIEKPDAEHSRIPEGKSFSVEFPTGAAEEKVLRLVVQAYNKSNPGHFEVRQLAEGNFDVVGTEAHDEKGKMSAQQVPLDISVTLPAEDRPINETVDAFARKSRNSCITISIWGSRREVFSCAPLPGSVATTNQPGSF